MAAESQSAALPSGNGRLRRAVSRPALYVSRERQLLAPTSPFMIVGSDMRRVGFSIATSSGGDYMVATTPQVAINVGLIVRGSLNPFERWYHDIGDVVCQEWWGDDLGLGANFYIIEYLHM